MREQPHGLEANGETEPGKEIFVESDDGSLIAWPWLSRISQMEGFAKL